MADHECDAGEKSHLFREGRRSRDPETADIGELFASSFDLILLEFRFVHVHRTQFEFHGNAQHPSCDHREREVPRVERIERTGKQGGRIRHRFVSYQANAHSIEPMPEPILKTEGLSKDYGSARALDGVSLSVAPGEIVGLLGPNGSGKTTAIRLILGFIKATAGTARVAGFDCWNDSVDVRKRIAYLPGELRLYEGMTGRRLVQFLGSLRGETDFAPVDALAKQLDIDLDRPLTQMSSGMKRKVALIAVLTPRVPLVILDEPTNALDPTMRDELLAQLLTAKRAGKAVLFSSHVLQEVEAVCDRVVILKKGKLVHEEDVIELRKGRQIVATVAGSLPRTGPGDIPLTVDGTKLDFTHRGPLPELLSWLAAQPLSEVRIEPQGLGPIYHRIHCDAKS